MRGIIAVAIVVLSTSVARAEDPHVKAIAAHLAAQGKAIAKRDEDAFRATLTADARVKFLRSDPDAGKEASWGFPEPEKVVVKKTQIGWMGTWGWVAAELRITTRMYAEPEGAGDPNPQPETATYHWLAVVVPDGAAGVKTRALYVAEVRADKDLYSTEPGPDAKSPGPIASLAARPKAIAAQLAVDPAVTIFGTTESDRGLGAAAAKKLVGSWKNLELRLVETPEETIAGDLGFTFAKLEMKLKRKKEPIALGALVVAHKTAAGAWEIVAVNYGAN